MRWTPKGSQIAGLHQQHSRARRHGPHFGGGRMDCLMPSAGRIVLCGNGFVQNGGTLIPEITIRRAASDDASMLAALGATTFTETFGHLYPPEDLQVYLFGSHSVDAWTRVLTDPQLGDPDAALRI